MLGRQRRLSPDGGHGVRGVLICSIGVLRSKKYPLSTCDVTLVFSLLKIGVLRIMTVWFA